MKRKPAAVFIPSRLLLLIIAHANPASSSVRVAAAPASRVEAARLFSKIRGVTGGNRGVFFIFALSAHGCRRTRFIHLPGM